MIQQKPINNKIVVNPLRAIPKCRRNSETTRALQQNRETIKHSKEHLRLFSKLKHLKNAWTNNAKVVI